MRLADNLGEYKIFGKGSLSDGNGCAAVGIEWNGMVGSCGFLGFENDQISVFSFELLQFFDDVADMFWHDLVLEVCKGF